ncbi:MAG TPA: RecQ family ATP-dependent DNA helicase [Candidatus Marinimicrobia bacterium]|nr:RecQ family ATP-dependent DNA helicase [Candidatus Neomarinimicrobiota bacterium]
MKNEISQSASGRLFFWDQIPNFKKGLFIPILNGVLSKHSQSSVNFLYTEPYESDDNIIVSTTAILDKIVTRGNPTFVNLDLEERILTSKFLKSWTKSRLENDTDNHLFGTYLLNSPIGNDHNKTRKELPNVFSLGYSNELSKHQCSLKIENRLQNITSAEEDIFYDSFIKNFCSAISRHLHRQVLISDILGYEDSDLINQKVDFCLSIESVKWIFEIDGQQHSTDEDQKEFDRKRDELLRDENWSVYRINAEEVRTNISNWFVTFKNNLVKYEREVLEFQQQHTLNEYLDSNVFLTIIFPHLVHRTIRALIHAIRFGDVKIKSDLKLLIIEEDVPVILEALHQLSILWSNLKILSSEIPNFPNIEAHYIGKNTLIDLPDDAKIKYSNVEQLEENYDLVISNSVTLYSGQKGLLQSKYIKETGYKVIEIRTKFSLLEYRTLLWSMPIEYKLEEIEIFNNNSSDSGQMSFGYDKYNALLFFLRNIFRKYHFWDGQLKAIARMLMKKPTIVLLPTGGGKSLTYQFTGLLHPGVTIIIDPLVSLMVDQVDNLNQMGFDRAGFISSLLDADERDLALKRLSSGLIYYCFLAPERLQMIDFRNNLRTLVAQFPISLAVIDEVHCVSEWGHDFRPSYLHLGRNIRKYCTPEDLSETPTLIGLTGTASFAVLTDVQMELNITDEEAIILPKSFDRKELVYHVKKVPTIEKPSALKIIKQSMPRIFRKNPQTFFQPKEEHTNSGIVFCPWVNGILGVTTIAGLLNHNNYYAGKKPKSWGNSTEDDWRKYKIDRQSKFKKNLIQELVATKSFGMGIDKPNIRYTIHYNIPHSIEAFYQEAGRAGRDSKNAHCFIIYSDDNYEEAESLLFNRDHQQVVAKINDIKQQNRGDLIIQMWLLYNSYQDRTLEKRKTYNLWMTDLYPIISEMKVNSTNTRDIDFGNNFARGNTEKAIFRLVILGIVEEYSVDWHFRKFQVVAKNLAPSDIKKNLYNYLLNYKVESEVNKLTQKINADDLQTAIKLSLNVLIDFVYDEIAQKRKQALRTMAEICRYFKSDEQFRETILAYLQESEFSDILKKWINLPFDEIGFDAIIEILNQLSDLEQIKRLIGTSRRMLDEDPTNTALRTLSVCARARSKTENNDSVYQELKALINQLEEQYQQILEPDGMLIHVVQEIQIYRPLLETSGLDYILRKIGTSSFIRKFISLNPEYGNIEILTNMEKILIAGSLRQIQGIQSFINIKGAVS